MRFFLCGRADLKMMKGNENKKGLKSLHLCSAPSSSHSTKSPSASSFSKLYCLSSFPVLSSRLRLLACLAHGRRRERERAARLITHKHNTRKFITSTTDNNNNCSHNNHKLRQVDWMEQANHVKKCTCTNIHALTTHNNTGMRRGETRICSLVLRVLTTKIYCESSFSAFPFRPSLISANRKMTATTNHLQRALTIYLLPTTLLLCTLAYITYDHLLSCKFVLRVVVARGTWDFVEVACFLSNSNFGGIVDSGERNVFAQSYQQLPTFCSDISCFHNTSEELSPNG